MRAATTSALFEVAGPLLKMAHQIGYCNRKRRRISPQNTRLVNKRHVCSPEYYYALLRRFKNLEVLKNNPISYKFQDGCLRVNKRGLLFTCSFAPIA